MSSIVIGKRITFGQVVMSTVTVGAFVWDHFNPENPLPAGVVAAISQAVIGIGQVFIVNKFGVTTIKDE